MSRKFEKAMSAHYRQQQMFMQVMNGWRPAVKNDIWMKHDDGTYSVEDSTLHANGTLDPWNRPFTPLNMKELRDRDNDVTHWTAETTIAGATIKLTIWND